MDAVAEAIARQDAAPRAPIDASAEFEDLRGYNHAFESAKPAALAILAWCQEHPAEVGEHRDLVEALRVALATRQLFGEIMLAIYGKIPETVDVFYDLRKRGVI